MGGIPRTNGPRLTYLFTRSRQTGISNSGSSVKLTRTVSPIPSSNKVPIPAALFYTAIFAITGFGYT